ncbi:MAG: magnesium/cobalt transporter CorA [Bacteroidia bacterium]
MKTQSTGKRFPKINIRIRRAKHAQPGVSPGTLNIPADAPKPLINSFNYNTGFFEEKTLSGLDEIKKQLTETPDNVHWIDIKGFGDKPFYEQLADHFGFHRLEMEDVFNIYQRPKIDEYSGHLFFVSRILSENATGLCNDQLSLFLGKNFVITIQEKINDPFEIVRDRIRKSKGYLRLQKADYLAYALVDSAIDLFFPLLEKIGDRLDELEEELIKSPTRESMNKILQIKRELIVFRRTIWPERDKINDLIRSDFSLISANTKVYFRDSYDHCIQILDIVDSYKEVTASLMDVYLSSVSNRLNQVMKVLTIISTIFIPLTFIVGIYGMNFSRTDPKTGGILPLNMPELYSPFGYIGVMIAMLFIVAVQLIFFYKKGWISFKSRNL